MKYAQTPAKSDVTRSASAPRPTAEDMKTSSGSMPCIATLGSMKTRSTHGGRNQRTRPVDEGDATFGREQDVVRPQVTMDQRLAMQRRGPSIGNLGEPIQVPRRPWIGRGERRGRAGLAGEPPPLPEVLAPVLKDGRCGDRRGREQLPQPREGAQDPIQFRPEPRLGWRAALDVGEQQSHPVPVVVGPQQPWHGCGLGQSRGDPRLAAEHVRRQRVAFGRDGLREEPPPIGEQQPCRQTRRESTGLTLCPYDRRAQPLLDGVSHPLRCRRPGKPVAAGPDRRNGPSLGRRLDPSRLRHPTMLGEVGGPCRATYDSALRRHGRPRSGAL